MSMSIGEVERELALYRYKPDWTFRLSGGGVVGAYLLMTARVQNSYPPHQWINVGNTLTLPPLADLTPDLLRIHWDRMIREYEDHEVREWQRYDGDLIDNPHAGVIVTKRELRV